jgi:hypothetical protein
MIEDIDYLYGHAVQETSQLYIDSASRDRRRDPHPSSYCVDLPVPFHNVYGLEILDASIPRTMYSIDAPNDGVVVLRARPEIAGEGDYEHVQLARRDYTISTLINELSDRLSQLNIAVSGVSVPPEAASRVQFSAQDPFAFDMDASTAAEALGFDEHASPAPADAAYVAERRTSQPLNKRIYGSSMQSTSISNVILGTVVSSQHAWPLSAATFAAQRLAPQGLRQALRSVLVWASSADGSPLPAGARLTWQIRSDEGGSPAPQPIATGSLYASGDGSAPLSGSVLDGDQWSLTWLQSGATYWLLVSDPDAASRAGGPAAVHFHPAAPSAPSQDGLYSVPQEGQLTPLGGAGAALVAQLQLAAKSFSIAAPGMVSMVGQRFILLRCPEIEQHLYGSQAYARFNPGQALFRLGVVGYAENRLDFFNVKYREFHPIARLSRLSFRFELPDGSLYDFKGVNHHLLVVVKYWMPRRKPQFVGSILNPNYDPDFMVSFGNRQALQEEGAGLYGDDDRDRVTITR